MDALCEVLIADRSQRLLERTGRRLDDFVHTLGGSNSSGGGGGDTTQQQTLPSSAADASPA